MTQIAHSDATTADWTAQATVREFVRTGESLAEELIAERRLAAEREAER